MTSPSKGFSDVIIGTQYGDEGKARVVDGKAESYDVIARFNGGANAGHTVVSEGRTVALHQVPSGVFHEGKLLYIGSGCVVNVSKLKEELDLLKKLEADVSGRLRISSQASVIQPHHIAIDGILGGAVGTTRNGIGPAYADKAIRMWKERLLNIRLGDLLEDLDGYLGVMRESFHAFAPIYGYEEGGIDAKLASLQSDFETVAPLVERDTLYLQKKVEGGAKVLFEGAQSFMLDVTKGSVPYVTSSNTAAAAAANGGDLSPGCHRSVLGVAKAVMSRVGHGPFPSEFGCAESEDYCMSFDAGGNAIHGKTAEMKEDAEKLLASGVPCDVGKALRIISNEYGATTSRPRRIGALDLVQLSYAARVNGVTDLVITKCDLLAAFARTKEKKIPLVVGYELDGKRIDYVPSSLLALKRVKPVIEYREGFAEDIHDARKPGDLPEALLNLLAEIEKTTGARIEGIGVGPDREQYVAFNQDRAV